MRQRQGWHVGHDEAALAMGRKLDVDRARKVLLSCPVLVLEQIDEEAKRLNLSRSEFIVKTFIHWKHRERV